MTNFFKLFSLSILFSFALLGCEETETISPEENNDYYIYENGSEIIKVIVKSNGTFQMSYGYGISPSEGFEYAWISEGQYSEYSQEGFTITSERFFNTCDDWEDDNENYDEDLTRYRKVNTAFEINCSHFDLLK